MKWVMNESVQLYVLQAKLQFHLLCSMVVPTARHNTWAMIIQLVGKLLYSTYGLVCNMMCASLYANSGLQKSSYSTWTQLYSFRLFIDQSFFALWPQVYRSKVEREGGNKPKTFQSITSQTLFLPFANFIWLYGFLLMGFGKSLLFTFVQVKGGLLCLQKRRLNKVLKEGHQTLERRQRMDFLQRNLGNNN